jgi:hypothetical protein
MSLLHLCLSQTSRATEIDDGHEKLTCGMRALPISDGEEIKHSKTFGRILDSVVVV